MEELPFTSKKSHCIVMEMQKASCEPLTWKLELWKKHTVDIFACSAMKKRGTTVAVGAQEPWDIENAGALTYFQNMVLWYTDMGSKGMQRVYVSQNFARSWAWLFGFRFLFLFGISGRGQHPHTSTVHLFTLGSQWLILEFRLPHESMLSQAEKTIIETLWSS